MRVVFDIRECLGEVFAILEYLCYDGEDKNLKQPFLGTNLLKEEKDIFLWLVVLLIADYFWEYKCFDGHRFDTICNGYRYVSV